MGALGLFRGANRSGRLYAMIDLLSGGASSPAAISPDPSNLSRLLALRKVLTTWPIQSSGKLSRCAIRLLPRFREVAQLHGAPCCVGRDRRLTGLCRVSARRRRLDVLCAAKAVSKEKPKFGKGSIDGLMAQRPATCPLDSRATSFRRSRWNSGFRAFSGANGRP